MEEEKQAGFKHDSEVLSLGDLENGGDTYKARQGDDVISLNVLWSEL